MKKLFLAMFAFAYATAAHADWQYTHWGQSLDELLAMTYKGIRKATPEETYGGTILEYGQALAVGAYSTSEFTFPVNFLFAGSKLSGVVLSMDTISQAFAVRARLNDQYGDPTKSDKRYNDQTSCTDEDSAWVDKGSGNIITTHFWYCSSLASHTFTLMYRPILNAKDTGL